MDESRDPLDLPEEMNLDFMDCPECGEMASIGTMDISEMNDGGGGQIFMWRTHCVNRHIRDNYWFHVDGSETA